MHVVVLTDDHPPMVGGVSVFTDRVARELVARGHRVTVVARARPDICAIPGTRLRTVWAPRALRGLAFAARAASALRDADRVLATTWPVATGLARAGVRFDVVAHGSDVTRPPADPAGFARVWGAASRRFAMSRFLAASVDAEVLPAPVPLPDAPRVGGSGWVTVARATPLKGGDRFVRWAAAAGERGVVVGDGPELARWQALADALGAPVRFTGALAPPLALEVVRGSALAVLAPRVDADGTGAEGFGFALVEAMAHGVPAVGCATGGVPEAVGPGLVVSDPDDPARCTAEIRSFLDSDPGPAAFAWARAHHGVARTVDAWLTEPAR